MFSKFFAPSQHPGSTRNTLSNYKIVSSRMKTFLERRNSWISNLSSAPMDESQFQIPPGYAERLFPSPHKLPPPPRRPLSLDRSRNRLDYSSSIRASTRLTLVQ
jgi:hypothetical protein